MKETKDIMVCIRCITYNHEKYLTDALEGFVMQKTNFRFVAIVHDDCSTDKSADIIREYAEKYPDIIHPIYETENQWSKHDGSLQRIMDEAVAATGSKYIALCEGDDYWTDPYKLQKQVDFLENHPDYSMCFHAAKIKNESDLSDLRHIACEQVENREYFANEVFERWIVPTASIVYRRERLMNYNLIDPNNAVYGDIVLVEKCAHRGRIWAFAEAMSVYRVQNNGAVLSTRHDKSFVLKKPDHFRMLYDNFPLIDRKTLRWLIAQSYYSCMKVRGNVFLCLSDFVHMIYWSPAFSIQKITNLLGKILKL